jgi:hypothetical protein
MYIENSSNIELTRKKRRENTHPAASAKKYRITSQPLPHINKNSPV